MSALVSIIIPIYNLEKYIKHCLESVVNQTYKELEIICIDDGSTDGSAEIIKSMAESDPRIKYIYQENAGVSAARNKGLDTATGEYVMFVDGDDYLHYQTVEILSECLKETDADIVCTHFDITSDLDKEQKQIKNFEYHKADFNELFTEKFGSVIGKSSCAKLIKSDFAKKEKFPIGISNGEDGFYVIMLLNRCPSVYVVNQQLYYYYTRENSAVTSAFTLTNFSITYSFDDLCDHLKDSKNAFLKKYCLQYLFQTIFYNRTRAIGTESEKFVLDESKRIGSKWIKDFRKNKDISPVIKIMFTVFFYSRHVYELARAIQDPTMIDYYKKRRKGTSR